MSVNLGSAQGQLNLSAKGFVDGINTAITALEKLKSKSNDASKEVKEFGDEANKTKSETSSLGDETQRSSEKIGKYVDSAKKAKDGTQKFGDESDKTKDKVKKLGDSFKTVGDKLTTYGDKMSKAGGTLSKYITLPATALGAYSVKKFSDFESAMSTVQATAGATADDMKKLSDKAKQMGESTKFSATESAEALNYMAMAGWKTDDMLSGLEGIMDLAAASGEDLATTSDIVTDALTAFGLTAKDSGNFADVLATASSNANTNVSMLGESFKYIAPIAGSLGYSVEDVAVNLGLMANAGIKGGQAGTAMRAALSRMIKPTDDAKEAMKNLGISMTDESGKVKSLSELTGDLRTSFSKLSDAEQTQVASTLFGQEAMSGMLAIIRASDDDYNKLTTAINASDGAAKKMSEIKMDNFAGQLTLLKSKAEGVGIQFGEQIVPYLGKMIEKVSSLLTWFGNLDQKTKNLIVRGAALVAALGPMLKIFGNITKAVGGVSKAFSVLAAHPIVAAVGLIATGIVAVTTAMTENIETVEEDYNAYKEFSDEVRNTAKELKNLRDARKEAVSNVQSEYDHYEQLKKELDGIVDSNGKIKKGYEDRAQFITKELSDALGIEIKNNGTIIENYKEISNQIDKTIEKKRVEATLEAYREEYTTAIKNQAEAQKKLTEAESHRNEINEKYINLEKELKEEQEELAALKEKVTPSREDTKRMEELNGKIEEGKNQLGKYRSELSNANTDWFTAKNTYESYATTIENYETANTALIKGDEKEIKNALDNLVNDFVTARTGTKSQLEQQYSDYDKHYNDLIKLSKEKNSTVTQDAIDKAKTMREKAKAELEKLKQGYVDVNNKTEKELKDMLEDADTFYKSLKNAALVGGSGVTSQMVSNAKDARDKIQAEFNKAKDNAKTYGVNYLLGFTNGIKEQLLYGVDGKKSGLNQINDTLSIINNKTKTGLGIASPSKITKQYGEYYVQGFINGIKDKTSDVGTAVDGMINAAIDSLSTEKFDAAATRKKSQQDFAEMEKQREEYFKERPVERNVDLDSSTPEVLSGNVRNMTLNVYSPEPIDAIEVANQVKLVNTMISEGFV